MSFDVQLMSNLQTTRVFIKNQLCVGQDQHQVKTKQNENQLNQHPAAPPLYISTSSAIKAWKEVCRMNEGALQLTKSTCSESLER